MKKKSLTLIIGLMTLALFGVIGMQLYFFAQSYQLQARLFDQSVHDALGKVVDRVGKRDANTFLEQKAEKVNTPAPQVVKKVKKPQLPSAWEKEEARHAAQQRIADSIFAIRDSIFRVRHPNSVLIADAVSTDELNDLEYNLRLDVTQYVDAFGQFQERATLTGMPRQNLTRARVSPVSQKADRRDSARQYLVVGPEGPFIHTIPKPRIPRDVRRPEKEPRVKPDKVEKVQQYLAARSKSEDVLDLVNEYREVHVPLNKRIHPQTLDSIIRSELSSHSINSHFEYKVTSARRDSLIFRRASVKTEFLPSNSYQVPLFPADMIRDPGVLTITFPEKNNIILANLTAMMGLSGGLLLILIFCFGYTIHSILRQKKISEMKTDFINNMTHEFKTPVSTIMLASEALKDPELASDKQRIDRLAGIIYDENVRLGNHIERVLNIAKIDKGDLRLEHKEVDMHEQLTLILDSMSLQLQKRNATVDIKLNATNATVYGDELHLSNVVFNLLDNAIKYSPGDPQISVETANAGRALLIRVSDKGIGMNRDQLNKIFDQFYRIPTGNLHDVKGFGLGLSYVNNIVKKLGGAVRVKSEKGKGSEFEITLPLKEG